jgi:hypothetical protein
VAGDIEGELLEEEDNPVGVMSSNNQS